MIPKTPAPGLDPGAGTVFGKDHAQTMKSVMTIRRKVVTL
jgi:hypothetical protein